MEINVKINIMQNTNILLSFVHCHYRTEGMPNCGMVRFLTGHY